MRTFLLGLGLLVFACGPGPSSAPHIVFDPCSPLVVAPAPGTAADQIASVQSAVDLWNAQGFTHLTLTPTPGARAITVRFEQGPAPFHGVYEDSVGDVVVNREIQDSTERTVVTSHELGHAMGLVHIPASTRISVMNPDNTTAAPTPQDSTTLAAHWGQCAASS